VPTLPFLISRLVHRNNLDSVRVESELPPTFGTRPVVPLNNLKRRFEFKTIVEGCIASVAENLLGHTLFTFLKAIPKATAYFNFLLIACELTTLAYADRDPQCSSGIARYA